MQRISHRLVSAALISLIWAIPASAQRAVDVGNKDVDAARLSRGRWTVRVLVPDGNSEKERSSYFWDVTDVVYRGTPAILSVQYSTAANGGTDSTIISRADLRPLAFHAHNPHQKQLLDYTGRAVSGTVDGKAVSDSLKEAAFDATVVDLVISALPLAPGYSARVPTYEPYNAGKGEIVWQDVKVVGNETVAGKTFLKVEVQSGARSRTLYLDPATRSIVEAHFKRPDGGTARIVRTPRS